MYADTLAAFLDDMGLEDEWRELAGLTVEVKLPTTSEITAIKADGTDLLITTELGEIYRVDTARSVIRAN